MRLMRWRWHLGIKAWLGIVSREEWEAAESARAARLSEKWVATVEFENDEWPRVIKEFNSSKGQYDDYLAQDKAAYWAKNVVQEGIWLGPDGTRVLVPGHKIKSVTIARMS